MIDKETVLAVIKWIETKKEWETDELPGDADIDHSALLHRLLVEKKDLLSHPPPRNYSYPWYEIVDDYFCAHHAIGLKFHKDEAGVLRWLSFDQTERFEIVEVIDPYWCWKVRFGPWYFMVNKSHRGGRWSGMEEAWIVRCPDMEYK